MISKQEFMNCIGAKSKVAYSIRLLIRTDAGLATGCEVTVDFEGIAGAALVWINPVFAYGDQSTLKHTVVQISTEKPKFFVKCTRILILLNSLLLILASTPVDKITAPEAECHFCSKV